MADLTSSAAPPATLYHYTTLTGACGIGSTQSLWATSIRHLNDATEYTYALVVLREVLEAATRGAAVGVGAAAELLLHSLDISERRAASSFTGKFGTTYVASLSSEPDRLSQWRAYCAGGGYAFGFRLEALRAIERCHDFRLVQ